MEPDEVNTGRYIIACTFAQHTKNKEQLKAIIAMCEMQLKELSK